MVKFYVVADRVKVTDENYSIRWNQKTQPVFGEVVNEVVELLVLLYYFGFKGGEDDQVWGDDDLGSIFVALLLR